MSASAEKPPSTALSAGSEKPPSTATKRQGAALALTSPKKAKSTSPLKAEVSDKGRDNEKDKEKGNEKDKEKDNDKDKERDNDKDLEKDKGKTKTKGGAVAKGKAKKGAGSQDTPKSILQAVDAFKSTWKSVYSDLSCVKDAVDTNEEYAWSKGSKTVQELC
eukprot:6314238-Amphidinium_carterae.1